MTEEEKRNAVRCYRDMRREEQPPLKEFLRQNSMTKRSFYRLMAECEVEKDETKRAYLEAHPLGGLRKPRFPKKEEDFNYDSDQWLAGRTPQADRALLKACEGGNAQALRTYYQLTKRLIEKQEIIHGLTADETTRRNLEADRQLREDGYRVEEMPEKPPLLSE